MTDENIMADIAQEGEEVVNDEDFLKPTDGDDEEEKETPAESPTENNQDEDEPSQEGGQPSETPSGEKDDNTLDEKPEPFHKHPRWQAMQSENETLRTQLEDLSGTVKDISQSQNTQQEQLPQWWISLAGNDDVSRQAYAGFQSQTKQDREQVRADLIAEQEQKQQQQQTEQTEWDNWRDTEIQTLKDEGEKFNENELLKVALNMQPSDENGNISLRKSLEILKLQKLQNKADSKEKLDAKKKLAGGTVSNNEGESQLKPTNSGDLRRKSWHELVQPN